VIELALFKSAISLHADHRLLTRSGRPPAQHPTLGLDMVAGARGLKIDRG